MLQCLNSPENFSCMDMTVLDRLRANRMLWLQQQEQQLQSYQQQQFQHNSSLEMYQKLSFDCTNNNDFGNCMLTSIHKMGFSPSEFATSSLDMDNSFSRPCSVPPVGAMMASDMAEEEKNVNLAQKAKVMTTMGKDSLKKRKIELGVTEDYCKNKRIKEDVDEMESEVTEKSSKESSRTSTSKDNSKASDVEKPDYIHVRARRGQATDNHSLAERARREKIGKKMKCLQDLVPGCNKITGKAGMLDEIINYVQSLQSQVEFLSMKLAALNPRLDVNNGNFFGKEFPAYAANFPAATMSSPKMANLASLQFNAMQQGAQNCVVDMPMNPEHTLAQKTATSSSVLVPEMYLDKTSFISQLQPFSAWDTDLQNIYNVEFQ